MRPSPPMDKAAETSAATPEEPVVINFWHHYSAQSAENETLMNVLIPKFEEENPGYKVNAVSHEWADLHDKILVSASSNTLPDVARLDIAWVPEFQKMNILVPLDQQMSDFNDVVGQLLPSAMSTAPVSPTFMRVVRDICRLCPISRAANHSSGRYITQTRITEG